MYTLISTVAESLLFRWVIEIGNSLEYVYAKQPSYKDYLYEVSAEMINCFALLSKRVLKVR